MKLPAGHWSTAVSVFAACTASRSVQLPLFVMSSCVVLGVMIVVADAVVAHRQAARIEARVAGPSRFIPSGDRNLGAPAGAQECSYIFARVFSDWMETSGRAGSGRPLVPGEEFGGYVIEAVAGRGGMGVVYRARQRRPERVVALKVITPELAQDDSFRARLE